MVGYVTGMRYVVLLDDDPCVQAVFSAPGIRTVWFSSRLYLTHRRIRRLAGLTR